MKHCTICKEKFDDAVSFCPTDGEVLEDDPSSLVNTVLDGQYQMEALLGKGGMGAVYRARHILLGDRVAIKVLPPEVRNNAEWLRRFRREGQAARRFRHPNAVTVYDLRTSADGTIYMVMEYVEGHTLDAELKKRGRFTASEAVELLTPIMSVLDTAHAMGVVHRDLKPENIMVGNPGSDGVPVIKLLDLGIAKMREIAGVDTEGNTALTTAGQVLGTPYYMSPEQWGEIPRDENVEIDGRADIYSLGLVFYEMVAGRRCYSGATLHELRREHISKMPSPLFDVVPNVPRAFSDTINRATAKDRADRQATASQLAAELKASLDGAADSAHQGVAPADFPAATIATGGASTSSDVTAPTIVEMNPTPTIDRPSTTNPPPGSAPPQQSVSPPPPPPPVTPPQAVESKTIASVLTVPRLPGAEAAPAPKKSKAGLFIAIAGLLVVGLIGVGIAAVFIFKAQKTGTTNVNKGGLSTTPVVPREVAKYWLELEGTSGGEATKVAGLVPLASGQTYKMHFVFEEDGYLYLIGPGPKDNLPTAFLTSKPSADTGLENNRAGRAVELSFPTGDGNWLRLDSNPGTENFTVIFSKTPLSSAGFLNAPVTGEPLSSAEQEEMKQLVNKYKRDSVKSELDESNGNAPFVRIKAVQSTDDSPLIFDIRIQHN